jgi:hypothetical protein
MMMRTKVPTNLYHDQPDLRVRLGEARQHRKAQGMATETKEVAQMTAILPVSLGIHKEEAEVEGTETEAEEIVGVTVIEVADEEVSRTAEMTTIPNSVRMIAIVATLGRPKDPQCRRSFLKIPTIIIKPHKSNIIRNSHITQQHIQLLLHSFNGRSRTWGKFHTHSNRHILRQSHHHPAGHQRPQCQRERL